MLNKIRKISASRKAQKDTIEFEKEIERILTPEGREETLREIEIFAHIHSTINNKSEPSFSNNDISMEKYVESLRAIRDLDQLTEKAKTIEQDLTFEMEMKRMLTPEGRALLINQLVCAGYIESIITSKPVLNLTEKNISIEIYVEHLRDIRAKHKKQMIKEAQKRTITSPTSIMTHIVSSNDDYYYRDTYLDSYSEDDYFSRSSSTVTHVGKDSQGNDVFKDYSSNTFVSVDYADTIVRDDFSQPYDFYSDNDTF